MLKHKCISNMNKFNHHYYYLLIGEFVAWYNICPVATPRYHVL